MVAKELVSFLIEETILTSPTAREIALIENNRNINNDISFVSPVMIYCFAVFIKKSQSGSGKFAWHWIKTDESSFLKAKSMTLSL